jgi:hypothetical protein
MAMQGGKLLAISADIKVRLDREGMGTRLDPVLKIAFKESRVLTGSDERRAIYLHCVDGQGGKIPNPVLKMQIVKKGYPSPANILDALAAVKSPTLFLFSREGHVFGAYTPLPWGSLGKFNDPRCFIFSVSGNCKLIPIADKPRGVSIWAQEDGLGWGSTDLTLKANGEWFSELGCDYFLPGAGGALPKDMLCRKMNFLPDIFEIYALQ